MDDNKCEKCGNMPCTCEGGNMGGDDSQGGDAPAEGGDAGANE